MDANSAEVASQILKYQTWFLKVPIHCEGCRRKVKKVLRRIDGVFTTTIDPQQQKVTVTGNVGVDTLIGKLIKAGKHAEIWPENAIGKGKSSGKAKKNGHKDPESAENHPTDKSESNRNSDKSKAPESAANCDNNNTKISDSKIGANTAGNQPPAADHNGGETKKSGGGGSGKKKKKKSAGAAVGGNGGSGLSSKCTPAQTELQGEGQMNLSPTRHQSYPLPDSYYPQMVYVATYNRSYPTGRMCGPSSYYVPSSSYTHAGLDQDIYQMQSAPLVSFEIFSDENANGCSVM